MTTTPLPRIGVDMAHYAELTKDTATSGSVAGETTYGAVKRLPGLVQTAFAANSQTGTYNADNMPYATAAQLGDMTLGVQTADIPLDVRAEWYRQTYKVGGLLEGQINPIDMAFGYRQKKSNGAYRYMWHYKTKAGAADETTGTQTNSINFQDGTTPMQCAMRLSDNKHRYILDDDSSDLPEGLTPDLIATEFFTSPNWRADTWEAAPGG